MKDVGIWVLDPKINFMMSLNSLSLWINIFYKLHCKSVDK